MPDDTIHKIIANLASDFAAEMRRGRDGTLQLHWASERLAEYTGYTVDELRAMPHIRMLVHPDDLPRVVRLVGRARLEGVTEGQWRFLRRNGEIRWVRARILVERRKGGEQERIYTAGHDITPTKRLERELRASEQRYRDVVQDQSELICRRTPDGRLTFVNEAFCRFFDRDEDSLLGSAFLPPRPAGEDSMLESIQTTRDAPAPMTIREYRVVDGRENVRWIQSTIRAILGDGGEVVEYQEVSRDITRQKQAEEALRISKERLFNIVEHSGDAIFFTDDHGRVEECNVSACTLFRHDWEKLSELSVDRLLHADSSSDDATPPRHWITNGVFVKGTARRADGSYFPAEVSGVAILEGHSTKYIIFVRDVTERRELAERMDQSHRLESLAVLAGGIAHDFNNLLAGISGNVDLTRLGLETDKEVDRHLDEIQAITQRAAKLTENLLAYSGQGRFFVENLDLSRLVDDVCDTLEPGLPEGITLHRRLVHDLPPIEVDPAKMQQVVVNLLENAAEAVAPDREGLLVVSTGVLEVTRAMRARYFKGYDAGPGRYVYLEVEDNGRGLSERELRRAFEPFHTTKPDGRGLGLSVVHGMVRAHQGAVHVESVPGEGSTFRLFLPTRREAVQRRQADVVLDAGEVTVLVVEDEDNLREVMRAMLEAAGYQVLTAADGQQGVETFERNADLLDVILLDYRMPRMNGDEALARIRMADAEIPVVLVSGYTQDAARKRFKDLALDGFLAKPFKMHDLLGAVRNILARQRPADPPATSGSS